MREDGVDGVVMPQAPLIEVAVTHRVRVLGSLEDVAVWALAVNVGVGSGLAVCVGRNFYGDFVSSRLDQSVFGVVRAEMGIEFEAAPPHMHWLNGYAKGFILKIATRVRLANLIGKYIDGELIKDATPWWSFAIEHARQNKAAEPSSSMTKTFDGVATREQLFLNNLTRTSPSGMRFCKKKQFRLTLMVDIHSNASHHRAALAQRINSFRNAHDATGRPTQRIGVGNVHSGAAPYAPPAEVW